METYAFDVNLSQTSRVERTTREIYNAKHAFGDLPREISLLEYLSLHDFPHLFLVLYDFRIVPSFYLVKVFHLSL